MNYKGKKVLVAGGTGLVGTNLIKRLLPLGAKIRATMHEREPHKELHKAEGDLEFIRADLRKPEDCQRACEGMEYVFMCAAVIGGAGAMAARPLFNVTPNVVMNCYMMEAAYKVSVQKYLTFGSSTAYKESARTLKEYEMFDGEPYDKYFRIGWVMRFKEKLCEMYSKLERPMPSIVLRPTNIYGPHDNYDLATSHVTPSMIRKVAERHDPIEVWGVGKEVRDLVYVDDVINAVLLAMEKVETYDPINVALGRGYSVSEILQTALEVDGYTDARIVYNTEKPTMIPERYVDIKKARRLLGWEPKTDLREGIRKTIEWYKENMLPKEF